MVALTTRVYALDISALRFGHYSDKTRLVLELNEPAAFRAFTLQNPSRLVIDLPAFAWNKQTRSDAKSGITDIRHGNLKPGISRIVLDSQNPIYIREAFTLPRANGKPPRLVIDFAKASNAPNNIAEQAARVFGTLDVNKTPILQAAPAPALNASQNTALNANTRAQGAVPIPPRKTPLSTYKPLVIIDPGHGGVDPGAIAHNGLQEKSVVLALGLELRKQLEATGRYRVKMTRHNDTFIELRERVNYARRHNGDLFISLHADSIRNRKISGASFYTLSTKASDAQTAKLAARENKVDLIAGIDLEVEDEAVVDILIDLARRNTQNQSRYFANIVADDFKGDGLKTLTNAKRHANFAVLKAPDIPSILIETGFMSNSSEAKKLNSSSHRRKIAGSILKGVNAYFDTLSDNVLSAN